MADGIASAIAEGFKILAQVLKGRERARMEAAIQAGEQYIFVDEKSGKYQDISDDRQKKLKVHYRKRFFANN